MYAFAGCDSVTTPVLQIPRAQPETLRIRAQQCILPTSDRGASTTVRNRLFHNSGDGTFTDVSDPCGLPGSDWITSVAIAEIDGDTHADISERDAIEGEQKLEVRFPSTGNAG